MKFTIEKKDFLDALVVGGVFAGKNKSLPILDCVKIKISESYGNVVSFDNENAISKRFSVTENHERVEFCVSLKAILPYVKLISDKVLCIDFDEEKNTIEVSHSKGSIVLPCESSSNFPAIENEGDGVLFELESYIVNNWIQDGKLFTSSDSLRPIMCGIYFYRKDGELWCASTDTSILFCDNISSDGDDFEFVMSKSVFSSVCTAARDSEKLLFSIYKNNISIKGNGISVISRRIDGRFPNFKAVIPVGQKCIKAFVPKDELISAIERCVIGANQASYLIKMDLEDSLMTISSQDYDFNTSAKESILVNSAGKTFVGFKATKFLDAIKSISTESVLIEIRDESRAIVMYECENGEKSSNKTVLVMPMKIN